VGSHQQASKPVNSSSNTSNTPAALNPSLPPPPHQSQTLFRRWTGVEATRHTSAGSEGTAPFRSGRPPSGVCARRRPIRATRMTRRATVTTTPPPPGPQVRMARILSAMSAIAAATATAIAITPSASCFRWPSRHGCATQHLSKCQSPVTTCLGPSLSVFPSQSVCTIPMAVGRLRASPGTRPLCRLSRSTVTVCSTGTYLHTYLPTCLPAYLPTYRPTPTHLSLPLQHSLAHQTQIPPLSTSPTPPTHTPPAACRQP
jgi:hypothetical protein